MNIGFIKFEPYLKSVLWGGEKIAEYKGIDTDQKQIGESWEISGVIGRESVVTEGADAGLSIVELIRKYKGALVGEPIYAKYGDMFPILVKFIDAKQDLSLQVHPNDTIAKNRHNSLGKTEMWYIIDTDENARINVGFTKEITPKEYEQRVANNTIMEVVPSLATFSTCLQEEYTVSALATLLPKYNALATSLIVYTTSTDAMLRAILANCTLSGQRMLSTSPCRKAMSLHAPPISLVKQSS